MAKKKALLLGGAGFIGINIAKHLVNNRDYEITIADVSFAREWREYFNDENISKIIFINDDFSSPAAFDRLDTDYDYVYMLASVVGVNPTLEHPEEVIRINTSLILNCVEWLKKSRVKKVLFCSSSECYAGATEVFNWPIPTGESVPLCIQDIAHPRWTYAITKILGESAFLNYARMFKFDATVVRYQNAFGPDMGFKHAIPHIIQRFCQGESPIRIYGHDQTRAFCYIDDSAEGTILTMESERSSGEIYHIGSMDEISMEVLTKAVGDILGYKGDYLMAPTYPGSVSRRCPDITKAQQHLGYAPKVHWLEGLRKTVAWYKNFFESGKELRERGFEAPERFANINSGA